MTSQAVSGNRRRLVLHLDINNTIVMKDNAKGLSTVDNVSLPSYMWLNPNFD